MQENYSAIFFKTIQPQILDEAAAIDKELESCLTTECVRARSAGRANAADDSATVSNDRARGVRDLQTIIIIIIIIITRLMTMKRIRIVHHVTQVGKVNGKVNVDLYSVLSLVVNTPLRHALTNGTRFTCTGMVHPLTE